MPKVKIKSLPQAANGASITQIGDNPYSPTMLFNGPSHENGGIPISYGGTQVEVEGGEPYFQDSANNLQIFGKLKVPGMGKTFKRVAKEIAKEETKTGKLLDKSLRLINENDPFGRFQKYAFNSGMVMGRYAQERQVELAAEKEQLASLQNTLLAHKQENEKARYGKKMKYAEGGPVTGDDDFIKRLKNKLAGVESGGNYNAIPKDKSGNTLSTAYGKYQFLKGTRKDYYNNYFKDKFKSFEDFDTAFRKNTNDLQEDVMSVHLNKLRQKYNNDPKLIAAAHRVGEGATDQLIKTGSATVGGRKITWDSPIGTSQDATSKETLNQYIGKVVGNTLPTVEVKAPRLNKPTYDWSSVTEPIRGVYRNPNDLTNLNISPPSTSLENVLKTVKPFGDLDIPNKRRLPSLADQNKLSFGQIAPELLLLATERRQFVPGQRYTPQLYTPYQVSFQDQLNQNQSTFSDVARRAGNNPTSLGALAAQKYDADAQVMANEFRTNQEISNQITNQNTSLLNQAELTNLELQDRQFVRQTQAAANTRSNVMGAVNSLSGKFQQNSAENNTIRLYENMFNYRPDENLQMQYVGEDPYFTGGTPPTGSQNQSTRAVYDKNGNLMRTSVTTPSHLKTQQDQYKTEQQRRRSIFNFF